jgi:hypothetical protein
MEIVFKRENEIKREYLNKRLSSTAESDQYILRAADDYEDMINKSIYNMSYSELKEMISMQYKNGSYKAVDKNISILRTYIDFCIKQKLVSHRENRLATFTPDDIKEFVHEQAVISKYINNEQRMKYENILFNEQDKLIIRLLYLGVRGRPTVDNTFEELINLSIDDLNEERRMLSLKQNDGRVRRLEIDLNTIELIKDTYKQEVYLENNGEQSNNLRLTKVREIKINKVENYVFRVPGQDKYEKITSPLVNSRITRMKTWLDNPYLSPTVLYNSGMIGLCFDIYKEKGEVTKEDLIKICDRYNYGAGEPEKYWFNLKSLFEQYKELLLR